MPDTLNNGPQGTLKEVRDYFGMTSTDFARELKALSKDDQAQIKAGIWSGTFTY